jgi:hypothetical protein
MEILRISEVYTQYTLKNFQHNVNIVILDGNGSLLFLSINYKGPKIAYNVWESTRQPEGFFNQLKRI